jgi:hypothetical protein
VCRFAPNELQVSHSADRQRKTADRTMIVADHTQQHLVAVRVEIGRQRDEVNLLRARTA